MLCVLAMMPHSYKFNLSKNIKNDYRPQRSWGKVMFLQASVILSTGGSAPGGGAWSQGGLLWGMPGSGGCLVLGGCLLLGGCLVKTPPGRPLLRAVRILLECILVVDYFREVHVLRAK